MRARGVVVGVQRDVGAQLERERAPGVVGLDRHDRRRRHRPEELHREVPEPTDPDHRDHRAASSHGIEVRIAWYG